MFGMEVVYSIFIPSIRRELGLSVLVALPATGLWIGASRLSWPSRAALVLPALMLETLMPLIIALPLGDWLMRGVPRKGNNPDSDIERLQGFFTIILGEGVYSLIVGSNCGLGFGVKVELATLAMTIYYLLFTLFFHGDSSKTYIHALSRSQYTAVAFEV
jgi:hypothetical protein